MKKRCMLFVLIGGLILFTMVMPVAANNLVSNASGYIQNFRLESTGTLSVQIVDPPYINLQAFIATEDLVTHPDQFNSIIQYDSTQGSNIYDSASVTEDGSYATVSSGAITSFDISNPNELCTIAGGSEGRTVRINGSGEITFMVDYNLMINGSTEFLGDYAYAIGNVNISFWHGNEFFFNEETFMREIQDGDFFNDEKQGTVTLTVEIDTQGGDQYWNLNIGITGATFMEKR